MRVVVDTNILVSRYLSPHGSSARVLDCWQGGQFDLLASEPILQEYEKVMKYARIRARHHLTDEDIGEIIEDLREFAVLTELQPGNRVDVVKQDPSDNMFLECAVAGGADYVVSGDDHLLALGEFRSIQILSPAAFLTVLKYLPERD